MVTLVCLMFWFYLQADCRPPWLVWPKLMRKVDKKQEVCRTVFSFFVWVLLQKSYNFSSTRASIYLISSLWYTQGCRKYVLAGNQQSWIGCKGWSFCFKMDLTYEKLLMDALCMDFKYNMLSRKIRLPLYDNEKFKISSRAEQGHTRDLLMAFPFFILSSFLSDFFTSFPFG